MLNDFMLFSIHVHRLPYQQSLLSFSLPVEAAVGRGFRTLDFHSEFIRFWFGLGYIVCFSIESRLVGPLFEQPRHPIRRPNQPPQRTVLCCKRHFQRVPDILPCSSYPTPSALEQFSHVFQFRKTYPHHPSFLQSDSNLNDRDLNLESQDLNPPMLWPNSPDGPWSLMPVQQKNLERNCSAPNAMVENEPQTRASRVKDKEPRHG